VESLHHEDHTVGNCRYLVVVYLLHHKPGWMVHREKDYRLLGRKD